MMQILQELLDYNPKNTNTDIFRSLSELQNNLKRKSVIFIVSDFISESFMKPLKLLKFKHQIILVNISDVCETKIPQIGHAYLEDAESGEQILVNTSDKKFQERYSKIIKKIRDEKEYEIKKIGIDFLNLSNEESFDITFNRYIRNRGRK